MEAGIPGKAWEWGVCCQLCPGGTTTSAATKAPGLFCCPCLYFYFGFFLVFFLQGEFFFFFPRIYSKFISRTILWSPWGWILDVSLPMSGGMSSFHFSQSFNAGVQTFLVPQPWELPAGSAGWEDFPCSFGGFSLQFWGISPGFWGIFPAVFGEFSLGF